MAPKPWRLEKMQFSFIHRGHMQPHRVVSLAGPISLQAALVFISTLVSLAFAGHLGRLPLSQAVLASSCYNITGAAVLYGLASGMETLCGQVCAGCMHAADAQGYCIPNRTYLR